MRRYDNKLHYVHPPVLYSRHHAPERHMVVVLLVQLYPAIWNNLPTSVIEASSLPVFRRRLKTHLFTVAFEVSG